MTKRLREIRKWGNVHVILLRVTDLEDMNLREGDFVDVNELKKEDKKDDIQNRRT